MGDQASSNRHAAGRVHGGGHIKDDSEAMKGFTDDEDVLFGGKTLELEDLAEGYPEEEKKKK